MYIYKKDAGFFLTSYIFSCPACGSKHKIQSSDTYDIKVGFRVGGYKLKATTICQCGFASNIIIRNIERLPQGLTFQRTCKDCGKTWRFNRNDILKEAIKRDRNLSRTFFGALSGSAIGLLPGEEINDFSRCHECGSRRVTVKIE